MTKQHFIDAATLVKAIKDGHWTHEAPAWFKGPIYGDTNVELFSPCYDAYPSSKETVDLTRAVQTAEAFIKLFREYNPQFDEARFLKACGLA